MKHFLQRRYSPMNSQELKIIDSIIGTGAEVIKGALLFVEYEGKLDSGLIFDSSFERGKPFQFVFGTGRVIKGWDLGLIGMKVGGERSLFVPAHLAYGERSLGKIPPHSNLHFKIVLLEVRTR